MESSSYILLSVLFLYLLFREFEEIQLSMLRKLGIGVFIIVLVTGQLFHDHSITYPVTNWSMYSSANPGLNYVEFILESKEGDRFHYPFSIITKTSPRAFVKKINDLEISFSANERIEEIVDGGLSKHPFEKTIVSLINIYSEENPDKVIFSFEMNGVLFPGNDLHRDRAERFNYYIYYPE